MNYGTLIHINTEVYKFSLALTRCQLEGSEAG